MTVFDEMAETLHSDENLSRAAVYRAAGTGPELDLSVIFTRPTREAAFGETGAAVREIKARVRLVDVPAIARHDTLRIDAVLYRVEVVLPDTQNVTATLTLARV